MACKKKKKGMVLHHPGAPTSAAAPATNHPPACSVFPYPGKTSEGGMERSTCVTDEEADMMGKANMYPSKETVGTSGLPTSSNPHPDNLPPESICRGIRVTLDNNSMWNEFFRCKTEMILTKQGSRMFPYCRFRISGLQPCRKYSLIMDVQPFDNSRYRWTGKSWQVAGKAECHVKSQPFIHPESPSMGQHWMKNPVSFYKLKLTNHISGQEGDTILQPMHRYLPRLHVVQTDRAAKDLKLSCPSVVTFTFPQTEFMAVTAYQNSRFAQLKVDYNPFAKGLKEDASSSRGLKMKLNSCKDKDGAMTTNEHHPVKKSLKSLLANHKPRSTKTVDSKPSASGHFPKKSATENDQSTVPGESLCSSSQPAQKLFSELIREAHVSLQRCNLEQLRINNSNSHRTEQTNPNTTPSESNREDVPEKNCESIKTHSDTLSVKNREPVFTKRKTKADRHLLSLQTCKDDARRDYSEVNNVVTAPVVSQNSSVDSNQQPKPEAEMNVKQHKRPAPLPLPALALFLKQRLTKSKKTKSKPDSLPPAAPSEALSGSQSSATTSTCQASDHASNATGPSKDLTEKTSNNQASGDTVLVIHSSGPVVETALQPSSPSCPNIVDTSELTKVPKTDDYSVCESPGSVPDGTPVLPSSDQLFGTLGTFTSTFSSTLTTSSTSPVLSPPHDTVFSTLNSPQTPPLLPSHSPTMKSDSLLLDPECSYFGFEPLSPASSPEPLPPLPALLALELDSTTSEPTQKAVPPGELSQSVGSTAMVFKWHTVLPPPVSYIDTSFTVFQPTSQTLPLVSITSPLLPSPTEPQTDLASSFQENEQSLPFPVELSPLALHLPLSPTFSSLDGGGLSPTPSIADLVHFFSTDDDLGMGVEFTNSEAVAVTCPPLTIVEANVHEPSQQVEPSPAKKPSKSKKKPRRRKLANMDMDHKMDDSTYTSMQPNLEEVEEQLFISFTSKEALKLHTVDQPEDTVTHPQTTPEGHLLPSADTPEHAEGVERISACEEILLRDLKLMKHKQVIHPVLQEVGLKMNLLDPTLVIDLQYLGVRLPIPPPGVRLEPVAQEPPPSQGVSAAFVSRTGKTTDVTQIKGWREKFTPSEDLSDSSSAKPEAGPSSDPPKKNLSAFCSDMLDEYLENEGKLIDERAASFSQPLVEPVVYELPARSTSYVRTLDSVLKKNTVGSPTTNLISGFIPPSKRPKPSLKETKTSRKTERKQKGPKKTKLGPEPAAAPVSTPEPSPAEPNPVPKPPAGSTPAAPPPSEHTAPEPQKSKKKQLKVPSDHTEPLSLSPQTRTFKRRRKLKPKSSCQTLSPPRSTDDLAPLESDSELGTGADQANETHQDGRHMMTRALLRQKDLEDGVVWEGRPRTSITKERAAIALTSLFTLMGFVSENPTAPIQLVRRRAPPCLNDFCRLGCVCSSLSHGSRTSHCGRPHCMLGCSCLKQKVVLLKNLDGPDSSPSHHGNTKRRRRKRRMKMAYVLKEADSVSQPAERVRILWKREGRDSDPDPTHIPDEASLLRSTVGALQDRRDGNSSCARVRGYRGKRRSHEPQDATQTVKPKKKRKKKKVKSVRLKEAKTRRPSPPADEAAEPVPSARPSSPPSESTPKPSKRLVIVAECKWASDADKNHVLRILCEAMALDKLYKPFWIRKYLISPVSSTMEESGGDRCIQYKVRITRPQVQREQPAAQPKLQRMEKPQEQKQEHLRQVSGEEEPPESWQGEVMEEEEEPPESWQQEVMEEEQPPESWQQEVMEEEPPEDWQAEVMEEEEDPPESWQQEVEGGDIQEEESPTPHQVDAGSERSEGKTKIKAEKKNKTVGMALPFLTGISPAGFLSARRKQPGGTDHLVQVNGKLYPLAKIQLGMMGALHPANRLAAYLTGRVGSNKKQLGSSSSCSHAAKPPQTQRSGPTPQTIVLAPPSNLPAAAPALLTALSLPTASTGLHPSVVTTDQSAAAVRAAEEHLGTRSQVVAVRVYPSPAAGGSQVQVAPAAPGSVVRLVSPRHSSTALPVLRMKVPRPPAPPPSSGQRMFLQPVRTASGVQYYRIPSGKLVQLLPISKLRAVNSTRPVFRVLPPPATPPSAAPPPSPQTPAITVVNQTPPQVPGTSSSPLSVPPLPLPDSGTFKVLRKEPIAVTCPKPPPLPPAPPVNLISLKPSACQGVELGIKTLTLSADPVTPGGVSAPKKPSSTSWTPPPPPPVPASDPADLDVVCVDVEKELANKETQSTEVVDLAGSSSSDTENSSDFGDESFSEEEKVKGEEQTKSQRDLHSLMERKRRVKMLQLFKGLRREVGLREDKTPKIATLRKAVEVIQELRSTATVLKEKKRRLMKRRDHYLSTIAPPGVNTWSHDPLDSDSRQVISIVSVREQRRRAEPKRASDTSDEEEAFHSLRLSHARQAEMRRLVNQQRDIFITEVYHRPAEQPGETKQKHLSSNQREMGRQERLPAANQLPAPAGGGASDPGLPTGDATDDDIIIISSNLQQQIPQAPPTNALPTTTPVHTPVHTPVQQSQLALQVPPAESHNAPVVRDRPKTIPNILSRRKNPVPPSSLVLKTVAGESPSFRALVPADLLALVGAALPGQHVLTLSPLVPPGVSSVSLTNQQIHVTSMPCPPTAGNLLQLLPPSPHPPSDQAPPQTHPSAEFPCSSSPGPGMSAERGKEVRARGGGATQSLMSLLDEIVILNQQTTATPSLEIDHAVGGAEKRGHAHGRELGLDNTVTVETEEAGLQGQMEITQTDPQSGPANGNTKSGAPAPPPLLQMKVGGATVAEPASGDRVSAGDGGGREGGAVAWRPMPRLVPLGLRGNTPS
ncbi:MAX dimerization protein MGA a isoform X2 [Scophthalmus maximus]|uniref:MAX dimerization protein MGA a isoform X2 n=1 Tax=Scophthalmus maximus TaxID=52904 RepID=UPI001FA8D677|nr:MAX dimerization protein MGA a isoform X2 [Scophthalmus maximus]